MNKKMPGKIVKHADGRVGVWFNSDKKINGKIPVCFPDGKDKKLVAPEFLTLIGYTD